MTTLCLIFALLAIFLYIFLDIVRQANVRLREDVAACYEAAMQYEAHVTALEAYCVYLEARERYNRAVAAGFMLTVGAVDVGEVLFVLDGETMP